METVAPLQDFHPEPGPSGHKAARNRIGLRRFKCWAVKSSKSRFLEALGRPEVSAPEGNGMEALFVVFLNSDANHFEEMISRR